MSKLDLDKIKIGVSPLTGDIYLYRHGKDPQLALDKREAEADIMYALVRHMLHDIPEGEGAEKEFILGGQKYIATVRPIKTEEDQ